MPKRTLKQYYKTTKRAKWSRPTPRRRPTRRMGINNGLFKIRAMCTVASRTWPAGATAGATPGYGIVFKLSDLPGLDSYLTLFDAYRISKVELQWIPTYKNTTTESPDVMEYYAVDYDSSGAPSSVPVIQQMGTCKHRMGSEKTKLTLYPRFATTVGAGGGLNQSAKQATGWLDVAVKDVPHFGLLTYMHYPTTTTYAHTYEIVAHYTVEFRQRR